MAARDVDMPREIATVCGMTSREVIGQRLQRMRQQRGLSPEAMSHAVYDATGIFVSGRTIRRVEAGIGRPTVRVQFALAEFHGVTFSDLWSPALAVAR